MSAQGQAPAAAPAVDQHRINWLGLVLFITSESVLFANLIAGYIYLRFSSPAWGPAREAAHLDIGFVAINSVILLASSIPVHLANVGIRNGNQRRLIIGFALTIIMGAVFMLGQGYEYITALNAGFTPQASIFGSAFFTLTGFHGAHVIVGLIFLLVTLVLAMRGRFSAERHFPVEAATLYWHFVDAVWVAVFLVVYVL